MNPTDIPLAGGLFALPVDDGLVLYSQRKNRVFILNHSGKLVWNEISAGATPAMAAQALAEAYGIPISAAVADVTATLEQWKAEGLIEFGEDAAQVEPPIAPAPAGKKFPTHSEYTYRMLGRCFKVRYSDPCVEFQAHPRLVGAITAKDTAECELGLVDDDGVYRLFIDGTEAAANLLPEKTLGSFFGYLVEFLHPGLPLLVKVHGAAVGRQGRAALMPAFCGAGKSTLTAALTQRGYTYFSDDIAPITSGPVAMVAPVPIDINLKQGSWAPLAPFFPTLVSQPEIIHGKAHMGKYITPAEPARAIAPWPVGWIVFPFYKPGARARLVPLSPIETLAHIAASRSVVPAGIENLKLILDFIRRTPSYLFELDSLDEAVAELETLWS